MAAEKRKTAVKRTSTRSKPKSAKNASAKKVKRVAPGKVAARKTATRNATTSASTATKPSTARLTSAQTDALQMGAQAMRQLLASGDAKSQAQLQQQISSISQESAAQLAKQAEAASRSLNEVMSVSKDNMDAAVTCSSIAVNASKTMGAELFNYANKSFSQNVEMSKEIFACRTLNDMFDLQSKVMKSNLDHFFNQSVKLSEMMFDTANKVSEPVNECASQTATRLSRAMEEAA